MALTDNLVAYYPMEGNSVDAVNGNNGSDTGMSYSSGNGKITQGGAFSGTGYITVAGHVGFPTGNSDFSVAAWVKLTSTAGRNGIFTFGTPATSQEVYFLVDTGGKMFAGSYSGTGTHEAAGTSTLSTGTWYLCGLTYVGATKVWQFYLNGATDGNFTNNNTLNIAYGTNFIGTLDATNWDFSGSIDELGFWSRALSGAEMTSLYNGGSGLQLFQTALPNFSRRYRQAVNRASTY